MALLSFDGSPHGGLHKLLPEWDSQPSITPRLILDHSIVGSANGAWWYFHDRTGVESHFIITTAGVIWQLMSTDRQADANLEANNKAISIETEDDGDPNTDPWSGAQLQSLKWLHNKLVAVHPTILRREATDCDGPGLGYHSKMGAPSCWTPAVGKTCPGKPVRVGQWRSVLLPAFLHPNEEDEVSQADVLAALQSPAGQKAILDAITPRLDRAVLFLGGVNNSVYSNADANPRPLPDMANTETVKDLTLNLSPEDLAAIVAAVGAGNAQAVADLFAAKLGA